MPSSAESVRSWRQRNPERARQNAKRSNAMQAAAWTVASRYSYDWQREYIDECERRGVVPFPDGGRPKEFKNHEL